MVLLRILLLSILLLQHKHLVAVVLVLVVLLVEVIVVVVPYVAGFPDVIDDNSADTSIYNDISISIISIIICVMMIITDRLLRVSQDTCMKADIMFKFFR